MKLRRLLILMLWLPNLALAQEGYYGTTAGSIRLSEGADPADKDRIALRPGEVLTPENVRTAIQALFDTGRYSGVEVDAVTGPDGTDLTFNVSPHHFFGTFILKPENLLERPLSTLLRLPVGQKFSESRVQEIAEQTKQLLQDAGYFNAALTIMTGPDNPQHIRSIEFDADVQDRARIAEVDIQGGEGIFPFPELRRTFGVSAGDTYNNSQIEKGLSAVQKKFLDRNYLNTQAEADRSYSPSTNKVRLTITVHPGQQTAIDTANTISEKEVRTLVPIYEEGAFDPDLINEGKAHIIEYLQQEGYFEASVEGPEIIPATADNPTRVVFSVNKGERHSVKSVQFVGNTVFTADQLQAAIRVHPGGLLSHGLFSDQLAKTDVTAIRNMYIRTGYEAAFVEVHNEDSPNHEISVVFDINENNRYRIQRLTFTGNASMPEADLRAKISLKEGDYYSPAEAENARTVLTGMYYQAGFPDVKIEFTPDRDPETNGRLITYQISEGRKYRIGEIEVAGNTRTADKFIRSTSGLQEYVTPYDPEKILAAQQKLYATGLFRHVDVVPLDRDTGELRTVLIQIEEAKQITVTPGIGVKEYFGPRVTLDIVHSNVFGGNRALGFRIRWGVRERQFQTTYHEPRLFNHESLDGYGVLTFENINLPIYETSDWELALQVRKRISATKSFLTTASYQTVNLKDVRLNPILELFPEAEGVIQIARIGASFVSDTRDDALDPHRGIFSTNTFQIASRAWGSEVNFISLYSQTTYQKRAGVGTVALASRIGWKVPYGVTPELPITERYFAGGSTTLRGFGLDEAGPPGGGQLSTIGNAEYRVLFRSFGINYGLGGALFYDTGTVFQRPDQFSFGDFTHSAGLGLRFKTPMGPIRFDVGFNLDPKTRIDQNGNSIREERTHYFFTLGHPF